MIMERYMLSHSAQSLESVKQLTETALTFTYVQHSAEQSYSHINYITQSKLSGGSKQYIKQQRAVTVYITQISYNILRSYRKPQSIE